MVNTVLEKITEVFHKHFGQDNGIDLDIAD